jgi:hypothetical protein
MGARREEGETWAKQASEHASDTVDRTISQESPFAGELLEVGFEATHLKAIPQGCQVGLQLTAQTPDLLLQASKHMYSGN